MGALEGERNIDQERSVKYRIDFTRHAERLPSGELSPEGIENAKSTGRELGGTAEVLKGYGSDDPSRRAFDTADLTTRASGITSPARVGHGEEHYPTREIENFQYDVLSPDLTHVLNECKDTVDAATLKEAGLSTERDDKGKLKIDIGKLSKEEQVKIAPIRQANQRLAFEHFMRQPVAVHRLAICVADRLLYEISVLQRYKQKREHAKKPLEKDAILKNVGHGLFAESLLKEAGVTIVDGERKDGVDFSGGNMGGFLQPLESFYFELEDPNVVPELIPIRIKRADGSETSDIFLSRSKLEALALDYKAWAPEHKAWLEAEKKKAQEAKD